MTAGGGDGTPFSALTEFKISKVDLSGQTVVAYLDFLVNEEVLIMNQTNKEEFGHYTIVSYVVDPNNSNFYTLQLAFLGGNGSIRIDDYYDIVNFTFGANAGDKTFIFTQGVPATTWDIQHNLAKFPSVTVINNNNVVITGEVTYIDNNNVQLNFSAGFTGKAYLN